MKDVARVELGAQSYNQFFKLDGQPAAGIAIFQLPEANALEVATRVRSTVERLSAAFPPGLVYDIPFDTTTFVRASIDEVYRTLFIAAVLVLIVIMVFVQDWRAILVPATTVPVTIIGAFAAMAALGFSVNLATLFAIVLAIGIVVDDAIVVVEGAARHIERGLSPKEAAIAAMAELFGPIIGITLVLMSVFLPAAFLPGVSGQLYRQFALVMAATALISAINAATLKPTQCALWLRPTPKRRNVFFRGFNRVYDAAERGYAGLVARMVRHSLVMAATRPGPGRARDLGAGGLADQLSPDRGPGLRHRRGPAARRAPRSSAPSGSWTRSRASRAARPASRTRSRSAASRCSTTTHRSPMPAPSTSSSTTGAKRGRGEDLRSLYTKLSDQLVQARGGRRASS